MEIYLPIAGMSINFFLILGIGAGVGFLSGLFGVGGGFLLTPLMMMIGIPPPVAAASDSNQIVAAASSGAYAHWRLGNVDFKMGIIILTGGVAGGTLGVQLVHYLRGIGNFEFVMKVVYVLMLGLIGGAMFIESLRTIRRSQRTATTEAVEGVPVPKHGKFFSRLPLKMDFPRSGLYQTSAIFPFLIGMAVGILAALLGVGGGFIMVPAMIYVIGMPTIVAIGTDLFQIVLSCANVTLQQAWVNKTVDLLLALILLAGSTIGAQFGALASKRLKGEQIRILLAIIVLAMAVKLFVDLVVEPSLLVSIAPGKGGH
ncbi:MAG: sulfite exporter TauE/SafE family protein [Deltaproteobacteria bacterium]|nr:sulfite exporter TauE/SafE family protein [Deltaproteobacteria bacterium]MBW1953330.1 sulfite exporter TauE/SafE family protein [Deltaproteobacteria bacterium]MBW1986877.1 sulfite exporter TauE/SafE family protein [Deltaproteobacteria bacterium]MBW2135556.1 sulfite exporter TauE/SafE family protein [Deltaproteobacteria bacterium]